MPVICWAFETEADACRQDLRDHPVRRIGRIRWAGSRRVGRLAWCASQVRSTALVRPHHASLGCQLLRYWLYLSEVYPWAMRGIATEEKFDGYQ